ncbi:MAG: ribonuclease PH [Candidatus Dadabacteria bacterium]|nr:ribonuclease PH [Candidatus Dadabacteria bacterium]TDI99165.1 MAG: ribonuclease PH [Candidatus Dadabacteria bacterium]
MGAKKRKWDQLRAVKITRGVMKNAEGSALIEMGDTKVLCAATVEEKVPPFLRDTGKGWVTTEYAMLPRATTERVRRDSVRGRIGGRSHEIQRIIGRALRAVIDLDKLGERSITIDCDVLQADGGTRTASITGAFVALSEAAEFLSTEGLVEDNPIKDFIAAVSVGIIDNKLVLDLDYEQDSHAEVDMNVAMTGAGLLVEVQGTAEGEPFSKNRLTEMIKLAEKGIKELIKKQKEVLAK